MVKQELKLDTRYMIFFTRIDPIDINDSFLDNEPYLKFLYKESDRLYSTYEEALERVKKFNNNYDLVCYITEIKSRVESNHAAKNPMENPIIFI